jgi:hypothetical protein
MRLYIHSLFVTGGFLLTILLGAPAHAVEPLKLYDDFNSPLISSQLWFGSELGEAGLDIVREALRGKLRMAAAAYGNPTTDSGRRQERQRGGGNRSHRRLATTRQGRNTKRTIKRVGRSIRRLPVVYGCRET